MALDNMNLLANVHNRNCVEQLRKRIKEDDERILELSID
jgi:hypothetical protein